METKTLPISQNLRVFRVMRKITQAELAKKIGTSQNAVSSWETGETTPKIHILQRICDEYHVPIDFFLKEIGNV